VDDAEWNDFATRSYYIQGDFNSTDTFKHLAAKIADAQKTWNLPGNVLFYLAVAPSFFSKVVDQLNGVGLTSQTGEAWRRVIIEKSFGRALASARHLDFELS
jgi:glucose-6-phosphate 1-dehydrogenase